eukprot:7696419-Alexandrium_andersonii.AAC.1
MSGLFAAWPQGYACESGAQRALCPVFVVSGCVLRSVGVLAVLGRRVRTLCPGGAVSGCSQAGC